MALTMWGQVAIQTTAPSEAPAQIGTIWVDTSGTATVKTCTAISPFTYAAVGGATAWGSITGTLSAQTDLQSALDAKAAATTFNDHSARHEAAGADPIKLDDFAAPDNNTDLDATTSAHGLQPKYPNTDTVETGRGTFITLSALLDYIGSAAQGDILYRGAAGWARLGAGTSGHFLKTQGAAADPVWAASSGGVTDLETQVFS